MSGRSPPRPPVTAKAPAPAAARNVRRCSGQPAGISFPFVIAGMAVARFDLAATAVRARLALTGITLAVIGYGGS